MTGTDNTRYWITTTYTIIIEIIIPVINYSVRIRKYSTKKKTLFDREIKWKNVEQEKFPFRSGSIGRRGQYPLPILFMVNPIG